MYLRNSFANRKETRLNMAAMLFQVSRSALLFVIIGVINLLIFSTYVLTTGNPLTPAIVFSTISLMSSVRITASVYILHAVVGFQEAKVAFSRIQVSVQFSVWCLGCTLRQCCLLQDDMFIIKLN